MVGYYNYLSRSAVVTRSLGGSSWMNVLGWQGLVADGMCMQMVVAVCHQKESPEQ